MGDVIDLGEQSDLTRSAVVQAVYDFLQDNMPSTDGQPWQPATGALDDLLVNGFGQEVDELARLLSTVSASAFRYLGLKVHKVTPLEPAPATGTTLWRHGAIDAKTVPAGAMLSVDDVAFTVDGAVTIAPGATPTAVAVTARDAGAASNGLGGVDGLVVVRDNFDWTPTVTMTAVTAGGADGEDDDAYLQRLVDELELLSRAAITADDFARIVQRVESVGRVLVRPRYNPATPGVEAPGWVTLISQDATTGAGVAPEVRAQIQALFDNGQRRIVPIQIGYADPVLYDVSVEVTVSYWPGFVEATVQAQVEQLVEEFLDPKTWGAPRAGNGDESWIDDHTVSALALAGAIERGDSVRRVEQISINAQGDRVDYVMGTDATVGTLPRFTGVVVTPQAVPS
jgi:hypothetical protein